MSTTPVVSQPVAQLPESAESAFAVNHSAFTFQLITLAFLGGGTGLLVGLYCFNETYLALSLKMIFAAILLLSTRRWTGTLLLVFIQLDLFVHEPRQAEDSTILSFYFGLLVLSLLMFVSRYRTLRQTSLVSIMELLRRAWFGPSPPHGPSPPNGQASPERQASAVIPPHGAAAAASAAVALTSWALVWSLLRIALACVLALSVVAGIPSPRDVEGWLSESAAGNLFLWPGPAILALIVGVLVVVSEIAWRQQTTAQSRMYLRSIFLKHHHRDLHMMLRRQIKAESRAAAGTSRKSADNVRPVNTLPQTDRRP